MGSVQRQVENVMESGARSVGASPYNPITDEPGRFSTPYNRERRERERREWRERRRKVCLCLFLPPMTLHPGSTQADNASAALRIPGVVSTYIFLNCSASS